MLFEILLWTLAAIGVIAVSVVLLFLWLAWSTSPARHRVSLEELPEYFRSWTAHLRERDDILVGTGENPGLIQFRKKLYKSRPDQLLFRFRNSGRTVEPFDGVVAAFEDRGVDYVIERTPKLRKPRAVLVRLDATDEMLPNAATSLCRLSLGALPSSKTAQLTVSCTLTAGLGDAERIPTTRGEAASRRLGFAVGRSVGFLARALRLR